MKILILNGPNLNLLGQREPEIYGSQTFEEYFTSLVNHYPDHELIYLQDNVEGELINILQHTEAEAVIFNAGGYTHTSVAIADCIAAIDTPVIEVHISNIYAREEFRQKSLLSPHCRGIICGMGLKGYELAIESLVARP